MNDESNNRILWIERGSCQNDAEIHWRSGMDQFHQSYSNRRDAHRRVEQLARELGQTAALTRLLPHINEYIPATGHEDGDIWIIEADGTDATRVTHGPAIDSWPQWVSGSA